MRESEGLTSSRQEMEVLSDFYDISMNLTHFKHILAETFAFKLTLTITERAK